MADTIKTIRLEDVLVSQPDALTRFKIQYTPKHKTDAGGEDSRPRSDAGPSTAPLDDIAGALHEAYLRSDWCYDGLLGQAPTNGNTTITTASCCPSDSTSSPLSPIPAHLYAAALRVALLPWNEAPQAVAASLPARLQRAQELGTVLGVAPEMHQQTLLRALEANNQLGHELRLQAEAVRRDTLPGVSASDPSLGKAAHQTWRSFALEEAEGLLQWHARLPEFNGVLLVTVLGAELTGPEHAKKRFGKHGDSHIYYAVLSVTDAAGNPVGKRHVSDVQPGSPNHPSWAFALPPLLLLSEGCELLCKVKCCDGRAPSSGDVVVGRTGLKLDGLQVGLPLRVDLDLFGLVEKKAKKAGGGGCGCFGGGKQAVAEPVEGGSGFAGKNDGGKDRVVYDPAQDAMLGATGRTLQGHLALELTYLQERRARHRAQTGSTGEKHLEYMEHLSAVLQQPLPGDPTRSAATAASFNARYRKAKITMASNTPPPSQQQQQQPPTPLDRNQMFHHLAARLHLAHRAGRADVLQPFGGGASSPPSLPSLLPTASGQRALTTTGGGLAAVSAGNPSAADPLMQSELRAMSLHHTLQDLLLEDSRVTAFLPLGWGLPLLLRFGKLYRIRPKLQRLVLLQFMLLEAGEMSAPLSEAFRTGWRQSLADQCGGALTTEEAKGLAAVMGLFLHQSLPLLNSHYAAFPPTAAGTESLVHLLEMIGWAVTWDPRAEPPLPVLQESLSRAANGRMVQELRVTGPQLHEAIVSVTNEVYGASDDLLRDMQIEEALPGLSALVYRHCRFRYDTLTDHLEMVFAYNPGAYSTAMKVVFRLESAVQEHHALLCKHGLAVEQQQQQQQQPTPSSRLIPLWDLESAMILTLELWIRTGTQELRQRCPRLLAEETWAPASAQRRSGRSAVEMQRMLNATLEPWVVACVAGGPRRRQHLSAVIAGCLHELLASHAQLFEPYWNKMLAAREMRFEPAPKPHHKTSRSGNSDSIGVRSMLVASSHARKRSEAAKAGEDLLDPAALASLLQSADPGITLTDALCVLRATFGQLMRDSEDLGETLSARLEGAPVQPGWQQLLGEQRQVLASMTTSYCVQYRDTLLRMLMSAFGHKAVAEGEGLSVEALKGILTAVHDELTCITRNFKPHDADSRAALAELVVACWRGAMSALQLLALNQASFRPLQSQEADWAREFLLELQDMYADELPRELVPHLQPLESGAHGAVGGGPSSLRTVNHAYCSALLQYLTVDSSDLCDAYEAQFSCLQQAAQHEGTFVEMGPQQVSLLDILRILRQRQVDDDALRAFVRERLRSCDAIATQVIFGLSTKERIVAEFHCFLASGRDAAAAAAAAASKSASASGSGTAAGASSPPAYDALSGSGAASASTSVQGRLYLTQSCICYTTLFDGDAKESSDTSLLLLRSQVHTALCSSRFSVVHGALLPCIVFTTHEHETYCMAGFLPGESGRLMQLLSKPGSVGVPGPVPGPITPPAQASHSASQPPQPPASAVSAAPRRADPSSRTGPSPSLSSTSTPSVMPAAAAAAARSPSKADQAGAVNGGVATPTSPLSDPEGDGQQAQARTHGVATPSKAPSDENVMSVPCFLYGTLFNTDGVLHVYEDHLEFINAHKQMVQSVPLAQIELIGQKPSPLLQSGHNNLLSLQVTGFRGKTELLIGGITEALLASLKQTLSDLCFAAG